MSDQTTHDQKVETQTAMASAAEGKANENNNAQAPAHNATAARNERWYTDPSKVVGVLGFLLALSTLGERMWVRNQEQTLQRLQQLREVVGSSRVDLQACKLEYSIVSPK